MIESNATIPYQRPAYIYGEVLSQSTREADRPELPGIGRFLSQGVAAGAFIAFLFPLYGIVCHPNNGYNFLLIGALPFFLAAGMVLGLIEGFGIWGCTRIARHRLGRVARAVIGFLIFALLWVAWFLLTNTPPDETATLPDYVLGIFIYTAIGVTFGLVTGSRLQPWRELVRGAESLPAQSRFLTGLTGLLLRAMIILGFMEAVLIVAWKLTREQPADFEFAVIALFHFAAALMIVFARWDFSLLFQLALLVNFPVVAFITAGLERDEVFAWYLGVSYLGVWAAFLLSRWSRTYSALAFVKEEIRYYLID